MINLPFNIGGDPEFLIIKQKKLVPAKKLLVSLFGGHLNNHMGVKIDKAGELGWDRVISTGEIRPAPSKNIDEFVENIKELFATITNKTEIHKLSTLSNKIPIGGHIHFELPKTKTNVETIHSKMMLFYIPIILGENKSNLKNRTQQNYGRINDYKIKDHKGVHTYESRVPTAEWLTTPKTTKATLCYLSCIYNEIINHSVNFNNKKLTIQNKEAESLQNLIILNFDITSTLVNEIKETIKAFSLYEPFKEEINFILSPKKVLKEKKQYNYNIVKGWNLSK